MSDVVDVAISAASSAATTNRDTAPLTGGSRAHRAALSSSSSLAWSCVRGLGSSSHRILRGRHRIWREIEHVAASARACVGFTWGSAGFEGEGIGEGRLPQPWPQEAPWREAGGEGMRRGGEPRRTEGSGGGEDLRWCLASAWVGERYMQWEINR